MEETGKQDFPAEEGTDVCAEYLNRLVKVNIDKPVQVAAVLKNAECSCL